MIGMIARPWLNATVASVQATVHNKFPATNVLNNQLGRVARWIDSATWTVGGLVLDLGQARSIDVLAALWHNLRTTDQVIFGLGNTPDDALNGVLYYQEVPAITGWTSRDYLAGWKTVHTLATPVFARYVSVRYRVVNSNHPAGFIDISRIVAGKKAAFQIGPQKAVLSVADYNQRTQDELGFDHVTEDQSLMRPIVGLDLKYTSESEMGATHGLFGLTIGTSIPLMVCVDLTSPYFQDVFAFGRPEKVLQLSSETHDVWEFSCQVQSIGP